MSTRIVTFLSDFGDEDHYSAAVKASLLEAKSTPHIIDISHRITPFDIGHAAYVIRSCFRQFPKGSIHLIALDPADKSDMKGLVASIEDHIFVCSDNGILSLISENEPTKVMEVNGNHSSFFTKDVLVPICIRLLDEESIENIGKPSENYIKLFKPLTKSHEERNSWKCDQS